jgi:hypothetical protein
MQAASSALPGSTAVFQTQEAKTRIHNQFQDLRVPQSMNINANNEHCQAIRAHANTMLFRNSTTFQNQNSSHCVHIRMCMHPHDWPLNTHTHTHAFRRCHRTHITNVLRTCAYTCAELTHLASEPANHKTNRRHHGHSSVSKLKSKTYCSMSWEASPETVLELPNQARPNNNQLLKPHLPSDHHPIDCCH